MGQPISIPKEYCVSLGPAFVNETYVVKRSNGEMDPNWVIPSSCTLDGSIDGPSASKHAPNGSGVWRIYMSNGATERELYRSGWRRIETIEPMRLSGDAAAIEEWRTKTIEVLEGLEDVENQKRIRIDFGEAARAQEAEAKEEELDAGASRLSSEMSERASRGAKELRAQAEKAELDAQANRFASILGEQDAMRREKALAARVAAWDPDRLAHTAAAEAKWAEAGLYGYSARDRRLEGSMDREIERQCEREKYREVDREY
jgi:hypothetical protein